MWVLPGTRSSTFLSLDTTQGSTVVLRSASSLTRTSVRACSPWDPCGPRSGSMGRCSPWTLEKPVGGNAGFTGTARRRSLLGSSIARCPLYELGADVTTPKMVVSEGSAEWTSSGTRRRRRRRRSREAPSTPESALWSTARDTTVDRATTSNSTAGVSVTPLSFVDSDDGGPAEEEGVVIQGNREAVAGAQQSLPAEIVPPARRREPMTNHVDEQTDRETEPTETPTEASKGGVHRSEYTRLKRSTPGASPAGAGVGAKEEPWYPRDALADACRAEPRLVNAIRDFVRANPGATIIYLSYAGSRLYGTSTATSDLDMKGIYIPGPPSPKPGGTAAVAAADGGNGGSIPLQQGRRAQREASSSVARSTSAGTSSTGTAGAEGGATPHGKVDSRNGTSPSFGFSRTAAPRPQTGVLRVDDEDRAFPAAERYSYSSANTSTANTEDDIDLELVSLDRFFLSLQRAEISAIETLFSMENLEASLLSDPKLIPVIRRKYPALVCSNPTAWLGYASGHLTKFHKLCLQEAVARCALASAATAKRLRESGSADVSGGDAEGSGLLATDRGDFGGSGVADGATGVAGSVQPGVVPLPDSGSPDIACVSGAEESAVRGPQACPDAAGVAEGGDGAENGATDSLEAARSRVGEVDLPVGESITPAAPMSENHRAENILIEDEFIGGGVTSGDAGDGAQQQAVTGGGLRVERGEVAGKAAAAEAIGEDDPRGEPETPEETIKRVGKRVGKVISHAKRVIVEAEELLETGRLTLPLEAHHVAEIQALKVDRMIQRRVEASLKADLRNLHKKAKESRLPSRVDRKHVIALRDDVLALHESRGLPRRRKRQS